MVKFTSDEDDEPPLEEELENILEEEEEILMPRKGEISNSADMALNYSLDEADNHYLSSIDNFCDEIETAGEQNETDVDPDLDYSSFVLRYVIGEIDGEGLLTPIDDEDFIPASLFMEYLGKKRLSG